MRLIALILSRDLDHGLYRDLTLEEQRRPRVPCASHAVYLRKGAAPWHGLAPMTHDVAEFTVFLGDPQGLAEPGLTRPGPTQVGFGPTHLEA
jgi:hypothetical protein